MAKTYTFRMTAEGLTKLKADLVDAGQAGQKAFDQLSDAIPGVGNAARKAEAEVERLRALSLKTANDNSIWAQSLRDVQSGMDGMGGAAGRLGSTLARLGPIGIAAGASLGAITIGLSAISEAGERITQIEGPLRAATGSAGAAQAALAALAKSAFEMGTPLQGGAEMFGRMARAAGDLGATRTQIMQLTETVQKLGVAGGASTAEVASGTLQLGQALASGRLQGDELRSIMESMPTLARAIADGLGVGVGQLREMGSQGALTSDRVFKAILSQTEEANRQFALMPETVERASQRMAGAWDMFLSRLDRAMGVNEKLAAIVNAIARGINAITPASEAEAQVKKLGQLLDERDRLLTRAQQRRGDLEGIPEEHAQFIPSFSNADTVQQDMADRKRLDELNAQIHDLEMQREADWRATQAESARLRQDAFKRDQEALGLIGRSLDEVVGSYRLQTEQLKLSEAEQKKLAAAEKARADYLKQNGIGDPAAMAQLQLADPARAVALAAAADQAAEAAGRYAEAQVKADEAKKRATESAREQAKIDKEAWDLAVKHAAEYDKAREDAVKRGRQIIEAEEKRNREVEKGIQKLEQEASLSRLSTSEKRVQAAILAEQAKLVDDQGRKTRDLSEAEKARITTAVQLREANEAQVKAIEEQQRATDKMVDDVVRYGADRFADMFTANRKGWRAMIDDMGSSAIAMFARLAFEAAMRPIVQPIVGAVAGIFTGGGATTAAVGTPGAASGGMNGLSSLLDFDKLFSGRSSLSPGLDAWAARNIGWGGGASAATGPVNLWEMAEAGLPLPAAPGLLNGGSALSGFASASNVLGIVGAALPGLISGNLIQAGFGMGGAALGTMLLPGIGTAIGGVLGNLVGGLFGDDKKPVGNAQFEGVRNNRLYIGNGGVTSLDDAPTDAVVQMRAQTEQAVNKLVAAYGLTINQDLFRSDFGDQRFAGFGNTSNIDLFKTPEAYIKALFAADSDKYGAAISGGKSQVSAVLALMRSGGYQPGSVQEIDEALALASGFDRNISLSGTGGPGTRLGQRENARFAAEDEAEKRAADYTAFLEKTRSVFGTGSQQDRDATLAVRQQALTALGVGPEGGGAALTGRGAEITAALATINAAPAALKAAGLTDAEITAAQAQAREKALAPYRQSLTDQMDLANAGGAGTRSGQLVAARIAAQDRAKNIEGGVTEMLGTAEALYGRDSTEYRNAQTAARNQVMTAYGAGPDGGGEALTGMAAALATLKAEALAAEPALKAAGLSTAEVAAAMAEIEKTGVAKLADQFQKDMDKGLKQLTDPVGAARDAMRDQVDAITKSAQALGDPTSIAKAKAYTDQIVANFERSAAIAAEEAANRERSAAAVLVANTMVAQQQAGVAAAQKALAEADKAVATAQQELSAAQAAVQQQVTAAAQAAQAWASTAERLAGARRELTLSELSPLSEADKLQAARARVAELRAQIAPGGTDPKTLAAMDALPEAIRTFLQLNRLFNTASDDATYGRDFAAMIDLLEGTETTASRQARLQQATAELLQGQLPGIGTNVKSIAEAMAAMQTALTNQTNAQTGVTGAQTNMNTYLAGQFDIVAGKAAAYAAQLRRDNPSMKEEDIRARVIAQHGDERQRITDAITDWKVLNAIGEKYWKGLSAAQAPEAERMRERIAQLGGKATFALGGMVGGGIPGMDSVPAMLMPGERVLTVEQNRIFDRLHRVVTDSPGMDLAPINGALRALAPAFRSAMVPSESLLIRILEESRRLVAAVDRLERALSAGGGDRKFDLYGRPL